MTHLVDLFAKPQPKTIEPQQQAATDPELVFKALSVIPNDESVSRDEWMKMGMATYAAVARRAFTAPSSIAGRIPSSFAACFRSLWRPLLR